MELTELLVRVATLTNEAKDPNLTMQASLDLICRTINWPIGHVYLVNEANTELYPVPIWHTSITLDHFDEFKEASENIHFKIGNGLPGSVAASKQVIWLSDLGNEQSFLRREFAKKSNLKSAFAFPVIVKNEVLAIFEFFTTRDETEDFLISNFMPHVGMQIGRSIERKRYDDALKASRKDLAQSNSDLEQFAYLASHDLRDPLREVISYVQLFSAKYSGQIDEKADKYIKYIVEATYRMDGLIKSLLSYSRAGRTRIEPQKIDMDQLAHETTRMLAHPLKENNATVVIENLPEIKGNEMLLIQVLQNLISNAIKYRRSESPMINISSLEDSEKWTFIIEDNGMGIAPSQKDRIFSLFQRGATPKKIEGQGMGLAISERIVERHGGKIWFESRPGEGTKFFFTVPKYLKVKEVEHERREDGPLLTDL